MHEFRKNFKILGFKLVIVVMAIGQSVSAQVQGIESSAIKVKEPKAIEKTQEADPTAPTDTVRSDSISTGTKFVSQIDACFIAPEILPDPTARVRLEAGINKHGDLSTTKVIDQEFKSISEHILLHSTYLALLECTPLADFEAERDPTIFSLEITIAGIHLVNVDEDASAAPRENANATSIPPADATSIITSQETEDALEIDRNQRREIQRRLTLIEYSTKGVDGVFGKDTRTAISAWQAASGFEESGFLDLLQIEALKEQSSEKFAEWDAQPKRYFGSDGCLREPGGKIVKGRTVLCDLNAVFQ